jgi:NAD(P)-dependent dehydrogenase (short-subunit alcohol dehydrogenase family)
MKLDGFEGRVALITGAAQGIGRRTAETFAALGAKVAGLDLRAPEVDAVFGVAADVTDAAAVDAAFTQVEGMLGPIELLVLNAGIFVVEPFATTTLAQWQRSLDVNLTGPFLCAQRALPNMVAGGYGRVVVVGSSAGINGGKNNCAAYAASKAGVMCLAKSIANEYAGTGVLANAVAPTLIDTAMMGEQGEGMEKLIPLGRLGTPEDIADLIAYLSSAHAGYITGDVVDINGGFLVH